MRNITSRGGKQPQRKPGKGPALDVSSLMSCLEQDLDQAVATRKTTAQTPRTPGSTTGRRTNRSIDLANPTTPLDPPKTPKTPNKIRSPLLEAEVVETAAPVPTWKKRLAERVQSKAIREDESVEVSKKAFEERANQKLGSVESAPFVETSPTDQWKQRLKRLKEKKITKTKIERPDDDDILETWDTEVEVVEEKKPKAWEKRRNQETTRKKRTETYQAQKQEEEEYLNQIQKAFLEDDALTTETSSPTDSQASDSSFTSTTSNDSSSTSESLSVIETSTATLVEESTVITEELIQEITEEFLEIQEEIQETTEELTLQLIEEPVVETTVQTTEIITVSKPAEASPAPTVSATEPVPPVEPKPKKSIAEIQSEILNEEKMVKSSAAKKTFTKAAFHEIYAASNKANTIFKNPNGYTANDFLDIGSSVVQLAGSKTDGRAFLAYISKVEQMKSLLGHISHEPVKSEGLHPDVLAALQTQFNRTETSLQLILQTPMLLKKLLNDTELLSRLFEIISTTKHFIVFGRIVQILTLLFLVEPKIVVGHIIEHHSTFIADMVAQIGQALSEDVSVLFKLFLKSNRKRPGTIEWMAEQKMMRLFVDRLATGDSRIQEETSFVITELLSEASMDDSQLGDKMLVIDQFFDSHCLDALFEAMKSSETSLANITLLLTGLIESGIGGSEDSALVAKFIENFDFFFQILQQKPTLISCSMGMTSSRIHARLEPISLCNRRKRQAIHFRLTLVGRVPSFGTTRSKVMSFIVSLVLAEPELSAILVETGFYSTVFEMFFDYPTNSVLHDQLLQLFLILCTREEDEMMEVFVQSNVLDRIGIVWDSICGCSNPKKSISEGKIVENGKSKFFSYFAQLTILANMIDDLAEEKAGLMELIEVSERWRNFTGDGLKAYNESNLPLAIK